MTCRWLKCPAESPAPLGDPRVTSTSPTLQEFGFLPLNTFSRTADPVLVPSHSFQGDSQPNPDPEQPTPAPEHDLRHTQTHQATNSFVTQGKAVSPEKLHIEHGCIVLELFSGKESPPGTQGTPQEPPRSPQARTSRCWPAAGTRPRSWASSGCCTG